MSRCADGDLQWPDDAQVLTACHTLPIATAALLTYMLLRDLHPKVRAEECWRPVVGVIGGDHYDFWVCNEADHDYRSRTWGSQMGNSTMAI